MHLEQFKLSRRLDAIKIILLIFFLRQQRLEINQGMLMPINSMDVAGPGVLYWVIVIMRSAKTFRTVKRWVAEIVSCSEMNSLRKWMRYGTA